ncbi:MAG: lipoprotein [Gallionellaceae bacterium]|nr:lipoprotein [Gallionellaceae bacterium]
MQKPLVALLAAAVLAGCASTIPSGPNVAVMPAPGKPLEIFSAEDQYCRMYAQQYVGASAESTANDTQARNMAFGTVVGAAAGALMGGSDGAGAGAAMGLIAGTASGAGAASSGSGDIQRRYDVAYLQCMYTKGNQIPQAGRYQSQASPPPPPAGFPPPPPPPGQ